MVRQHCSTSYAREVLAGETREVGLGKGLVAEQGEVYGGLCGTGGQVGAGREKTCSVYNRREGSCPTYQSLCGCAW